MGAQGSQSGIGVIEEVTWGVTPTGDFQGMNFTGESLAFNISNESSNNIRPDRQTTDLVQTGADTGGGITTEAQSSNLDTVIEGFFWNAWQNDTPAVGTRRLTNGVLKKSYSIERSNNDISQYFLYTGMVGSAITWTVETGSPITIDLTFIGKNEALSTTGKTVTPPPLTPIFNAVTSVTKISIDGVALTECLVQKLSVTLDNKAEGKTGIGVLGYCNVDGKSIEVKGSISMYFNNETQYNKYLNSTAFAITLELTDLDGNVVELLLPRCKYDAATANVTGKDDDVMFEASFVAVMANVPAPNNYTIAIQETPTTT